MLNSQAPVRLRSEDAARVTFLAEGSRGWASLCRLVSAAHQAGQRGAPLASQDLVAGRPGPGHPARPGQRRGPGRRRPAAGRAAAALARWRDCGEAVIEITDHRTRGSQHRAARMLRLAEEAGVPAVLSNAVRYAAPADAAVAQVLDAARQLAPLGQRHLARRNAQAYLASGAEMARIAGRAGDGGGRRGAAPGDRGAGRPLRPGPRAGPGHRRPVHAGDHG